MEVLGHQEEGDVVDVVNVVDGDAVGGGDVAEAVGGAQAAPGVRNGVGRRGGTVGA